MKTNTLIAKQQLEAGVCTCVLWNGSHAISSNERGVKPLLDLYNSDICAIGYSAADKVVGMGAAYLYVLLKVDEVFAVTMSEGAQKVLADANIPCFSQTLVPHIINRAGNGICPIESVLSADMKPENALIAIKKRLAELQK